MKLPVFKPRERRHLLLSPVVCFYKGQIPPNAPGGGGLTTFDQLLSPNQGRFALIKVKSPTSPQGGGVSRNNDRRIILRCPYFLLGTLYNLSQLKCSQPTWLSQNSSVYKLPSCARIFNYSGCARLPSSNMSLPCSSKHKKPVCDKCTAGTNCTKCCLCQPHSRGRPRKDSVSSDSETLARSNPERQARIHHDTVASASSAVDIVV